MSSQILPLRVAVLWLSLAPAALAAQQAAETPAARRARELARLIDSGELFDPPARNPAASR